MKHAFEIPQVHQVQQWPNWRLNPKVQKNIHVFFSENKMIYKLRNTSGVYIENDNQSKCMSFVMRFELN